MWCMLRTMMMCCWSPGELSKARFAPSVPQIAPHHAAPALVVSTAPPRLWAVALVRTPCSVVLAAPASGARPENSSHLQYQWCRREVKGKGKGKHTQQCDARTNARIKIHVVGRWVKRWRYECACVRTFIHLTDDHSDHYAKRVDVHRGMCQITICIP